MRSHRPAGEIMDGKHPTHSPRIRIQGGAGTTTNMNVNEDRQPRVRDHGPSVRRIPGTVSPNDDVNCAQSTNDAYPTGFIIHLGNVRYASEAGRALRSNWI